MTKPLVLSSGTVFQKKAWRELSKIPKEETKTYKENAIAIVHPLAVRAVANACGKNPHPTKIPCHRVIRSDGKLGGYSAPGGTAAKRRLLKEELKT